MLRFAVLLLQAALLPGAFLLRPTFLNLFDLPVFFEVAGVYGYEKIARQYKDNCGISAEEIPTRILYKKDRKKEYHSYQDKTTSKFCSSHGVKGFGLSQT